MGLGLYPKVKAIPVDIYNHIYILYTWLDAKTGRKRIEEDRTVEAMRGHDRRERSKGSEDDRVWEICKLTEPDLLKCGQVPQRGGHDNLWAHSWATGWYRECPYGQGWERDPSDKSALDKESLKFLWVWRLKDGNVSVKQNVVNIYTQRDITQPKKWRSCHLWQCKWTLRALCEVK